jgi:hypothetical protein
MVYHGLRLAGHFLLAGGAEFAGQSDASRSGLLLLTKRVAWRT